MRSFEETTMGSTSEWYVRIVGNNNFIHANRYAVGGGYKIQVDPTNLTKNIHFSLSQKNLASPYCKNKGHPIDYASILCGYSKFSLGTPTTRSPLSVGNTRSKVGSGFF
jgi:hypothetical protein